MMLPTVSLGANQEPSERYRQLFEEAPVAYHEIDTSGLIRSVNQAECELLGYSSEEMLGRPVWEFIAADFQETSRRAIAEKIARIQAVTPIMREYRRADGRYLWVEVHEKLISTSSGEVLGIRSALVDITERRQSDVKLRAHSEWM